MADDFEGMSVFLAVAEALNFRVAGERLGVTRSAVSQALQRLGDRIGVALVQRTTRSVRLSEAGELLYDLVKPPARDLSDAVQAVRDMQRRPTGLLRLAVSSIAERFISGPLLADFLAAHPDMKLDITITDDEFDIVAAGFDAGVRLGEVIERDMIAVRVSPEQRQCAVASPGYLARRGPPRHPRELPDHACIGWRPRPDTAPYRWEFTENRRDFDVAVDPVMTTNDMGLMIRMACAGAGITFGMEESFRGHIASGELEPILEEYCPTFAGFYLYYPSRRNIAPKLRVLVDYLQRQR
jgi:DNA-binding transcriptional LysR family regulator